MQISAFSNLCLSAFCYCDKIPEIKKTEGKKAYFEITVSEIVVQGWLAPFALSLK
jgi:hypothetical protein